MFPLIPFGAPFAIEKERREAMNDPVDTSPHTTNKKYPSTKKHPKPKKKLVRKKGRR